MRAHNYTPDAYSNNYIKQQTDFILHKAAKCDKTAILEDYK